MCGGTANCFGWSAGCMNEGHSVGAGDSVVPLDDV